MVVGSGWSLHLLAERQLLLWILQRGKPWKVEETKGTNFSKVCAAYAFAVDVRYKAHIWTVLFVFSYFVWLRIWLPNLSESDELPCDNALRSQLLQGVPNWEICWDNSSEAEKQRWAHSTCTEERHEMPLLPKWHFWLPAEPTGQ